MPYKLIIAAISCVSSFSSQSQEVSSLARKPYRLEVVVDKKTVYTEEIKATNYVLPNKAVQMYPGETIYLELSEENGIVTKVTAVPAIADSTKTITLKFLQSTKRKVHEMMVLSVHNPFGKDLHYNAKIFLLNGSRWIDTSVIPVRSGLSSFETWPDIITSIAIGNWSFKD